MPGSTEMKNMLLYVFGFLAHRTLIAIILAVGLISIPGFVAADDCDDACQAARKAQDPLADVKAIMTDNTIAFGASDDETAYTFQIQPVYTVNLDNGDNLILRGILPISGVPDNAYLPWFGLTPPGTNTIWGLGDTMVQAFYVPQTDGGIKFGFGPQFSLPTHTDPALAGPEFGAGAAAVAFGFAGNLSYGGIVGHHWGQKGFSLTTLQPIAMYNVELFGGSYFGYNNSITYDWDAKAWQVPLGLTFGKTFVFEDGHALDMSVGAYSLAIRPDGAPDFQIKFGISVFFP